MHATAGANPEAAAITEVIRGGSEQAAQTGPVGLGYGKVSGEKALASLVEGVAAWSESHKLENVREFQASLRDAF
jgi:hypothetical protein